MKTILVTLKGVTPLLMHSCVTVNPLHPITKEMKRINAKKKNMTDEDHAKLSDLEWEAGLYWHDGSDFVGPYIPAENLEATIRGGAAARRKGKDITKGLSVMDMHPRLDYGEDLTMDQLKADFNYRDVRVMKVMRSRVNRTRPRFNMWSVTFRAVYDEAILDFDSVKDALEYAGQYVGLCDSRPKYGKFVVAKIQELD